jgi:hypothetical protein
MQIASVYTRVRCFQTANASTEVSVGLCFILAYFALLCPRVPWSTHFAKAPNQAECVNRLYRRDILHRTYAVNQGLALFDFLWLSLVFSGTDRIRRALSGVYPRRRHAARSWQLRSFQYCPYSQYLSLFFTKFPYFDRAANRVDTQPRQYQNQGALGAVMKRDAESFTRAITTKVTATEFKQLEQLWSESGMSRSEWCRKVLLERANLINSNGNSYIQNETALLLAEVLALRTITVNLLHSLGSGETISREKLTNLTELADREKLRRAIDRLREFSKK